LIEEGRFIEPPFFDQNAVRQLAQFGDKPAMIRESTPFGQASAHALERGFGD
jgi:hypothetical protein